MNYRKLKDLKKLPNNPRTIKTSDFDKLCKSIKDSPDYFEARPLILSDRTGELIIIAGNQRFEAAKTLKLKEVPTYLIKDLTEEREKEIIIRDNVSNGEWDMDLLANEWDQNDLENWGVDLPVGWGEEIEAEEDDYEVPDGGIETDIVLGDLFEIGEHRLLCGDSTDSDSVARLMDGEKADMVFTDPPYNVAFNGRSGKFDVIENDNLPENEFEDLIDGFVSVLNILNPDNYYVWCNWKFYGLLQSKLEFKACIVWAKNVFGLGRGYRHQHEFCLFNGKLDDGRNSESDLWKMAKDSNYVHPTQKPIELSVKALNNHKGAKNIVDLFGGSGSTLCGIHQSKRRGFIVELDPKYCQVIIDRMKKLDASIVIKKNGELI